MTTLPDHYAALGIDPTADPEVITAAYRALAKKFHPDTGAAAGTASAARFDAIQKAYEVLRNPDTRHAYDFALLEATERELQAHIASKRRVAVRETQRASTPPPDLDLGDIRPEPAMPPGAAARKKAPRSLVPFLVPLLLLVMAGGGAAYMFLPGVPQQQAAVTAPTAPAATAEAEAPAVAAPAPQPAPQPAPMAETPVFGSAASAPAAEAAPRTDQASIARPVPEPASAPAGGAAAAAPVFGSSGSEPLPEDAATAPQDPEAPAEAPPVPKARPAQPAKQAQKPAAKPATKQAQPVQKKPPQQQPRARLAYEDPPEYFPEPDGFPPPPPGMEPPGFPGYDAVDMPPPGFRPGRGPYRLVIFERQPGRQATAWSAGVVFKSMGKCTKQGVKAVLRRTSGMDPYDESTRVWFECQQLSQR